ncbi:MAG: outer membrane protein assembly factor BamD [Acidobacteria bacterium]|nr:outer membrane protein assembly factor BamD [Acidobacteriota bacterium]
MKASIFFALFALVFVLGSVSQVAAQRNPTPAIQRDPVMEADAKHNLDVAQQAFTPLKQAYKQVLSRFDETFAAYPDFSKMDEFLYIAGMSSFYLSENKGKQKVDPKSKRDMERFAHERLVIDAKAFLSMIIDKYPQSKFVEDARKGLKEIEESEAKPGQ